ncbi:lysophospholipase 2 [Penicillium tannophilum]|nr:lysophospholipase 2 [Penicillium tannophilum]
MVLAWLRSPTQTVAASDSPDKADLLHGAAGSSERDSISPESSLFQRQVLPNAPDGYSPQAKLCPMRRPFIRNGSSLSSNGTTWLKQRRNVTVDAMMEFLGRLDFNSFNASSYIEKHASNSSALPIIGIAVSGGGYRALMNGGGALQAFDSRTANASLQGHLGVFCNRPHILPGSAGAVGWLDPYI